MLAGGHQAWNLLQGWGGREGSVASWKVLAMRRWEQHLTPDKLPLHFAYTSAFAFDDLSDVDCAVDTGSVGGPAGGAALDFLGVVTNFWTHVDASNEDDTHFLNGIA